MFIYFLNISLFLQVYLIESCVFVKKKKKKMKNMFFSCINELKAKIFLCMFFFVIFYF